MKLTEQIQNLVANARTEDALNLLAKHHRDAINLLAQYNSSKRQNNLGLMDNAEWFRVNARINNSVLELAEMVERTGGGGGAASGAAPLPESVPEVKPTAPVAARQPLVFISYNHADTSFAEKVYYFLKSEDCRIRIDFEDMRAGEDIEVFINKSIKDCDVVLMLVSRNSLRSTWVSKEVTITKTLEQVSDKKLIPVGLDDALFNDEFFFEAMEEIEEKTKRTKEYIRKAIDKNYGIRSFQDDLDRLSDAGKNLDKILGQLKGALVVDVSGDKFSSGMKRVIKTIKEERQ